MSLSANSELENRRLPATVMPPAGGERYKVLGDNQRHILTGEETNGAYFLMEQVNAPGVSVPLHYHTREDEIFQVIEGQMRFTCEGDKFVAGPGTTVNLPRGTRHAFEVIGEKKARVLVTTVPAGIEFMFRELAQLPEVPPNMDEVARICGRFGVFFA
jgi:quercetin dioxygenase-like cupin family protein